MSIYRLRERGWRSLLAALLIAASLIAAGAFTGRTALHSTLDTPPQLAGPHDDFGG